MTRKPSNRKCAVEICMEPVGMKGAKDFCPKHYSKFVTWGDPNHPMVRLRRLRIICIIRGCSRPRKKLEWCHMHYRRWRLYGDVGPSDTEYGKGCFTPFGYRLISVNGKQRFEHRVIMERIIGRPLKRTEEVHHRDGCPWHNAEENLQLVTSGEHHKIHSKPHWGPNGKDCASCKKFLPLSEFYFFKGKPLSYCKECHRIKTHAYRSKLKSVNS